MTVIDWQQSTRPQLSAAREADAIVVVPLGACEQHGPHLPGGTDNLLVASIARAAAERASVTCPIVITPTVSFGQSRHHHNFGPTLSITSRTLEHVLHDLGTSVFRSGFRRLLFLNGHGGNAAVIEVVAAELATDQAVVVGAASYWKVASTELQRTGHVEAGRPSPGHAGHFETSLMLATHPDVVDMSAISEDASHQEATHPDTYRLEPRWWNWSQQGYSDHPATAGADWGGRAFTVIADAVSEVFTTMQRHPLER